MANFATANLVKAQAIMSQMFNKGELRYRVPATFLEFVKQREIMFPSHNTLRTREDRPVEVNYFTRSARALGTGGRTHNHTGSKGDSAVITPAWQTYDDGFKYSLKQADISVYDLEMQLAHEYGQIVSNFAEGLETIAADYLFSNRSGVNGYAAQGTFNDTNDAFEIAEANEERGIQIIKSTMDFLKYQGLGYTIFCDTIAYDKFEYFANQGGANSSNLSFQFSGATFVKTIDFDSDAAGLSYTKGFAIAVPVGMIASLDWIPRQNRNGYSDSEGIFSSLINPIDGLSYAEHSYKERSDESASNGMAQDVKTEVEVSIDIALEHAPLTTANETPIQAFAIV